MTDLIIHHANCPDGFGAAWWLGKHLGDHEKFPANWQDEPPWHLLRSDRDVWVVDFSYHEEQLHEMQAKSKSVTVFDHHATTLQQLQGCDGIRLFSAVTDFFLQQDLDDHHYLSAILSMDHSGVGLVADYVDLRWGVDRPQFLWNIEDRDLWRMSFLDTEDVATAIRAYDQTDEDWDKISEMLHKELRQAGSGMNIYRKSLIKKIIENPFTLILGQYEIPCVSAPYEIGSDVANELAQESVCGIGAYVIIHGEDVQIGLRSTDHGPNVALLAESFGGGGHPHASGLKMEHYKFVDRIKEAM